MFAPILSLILSTQPTAHAQTYELALTTSVQTVRDRAGRRLTPRRPFPERPRCRCTGLKRYQHHPGLQHGPGGKQDPSPHRRRHGGTGLQPRDHLTQYQLGARYRWNWKKRLVPTTTVSFQLGHATLRMDENVDNDGEEVETRNEAVAMGFEFGGGLEYTVAYLSDEQVRFNVGFEAGYTNLMKLSFEATENGPEEASLGELNPGGPFLTLSVGTRSGWGWTTGCGRWLARRPDPCRREDATVME